MKRLLFIPSGGRVRRSDGAAPRCFGGALKLFFWIASVCLFLSAPAAEAWAAGAPWDGTVDVSWYAPDQTEFFIDTPAKLAGLAALVNGMTDPGCPEIIGGKPYISAKAYAGVMLVGAGGGNVSDTVYVSDIDFAYKTVYLTADLDMGGVYNSASGTWSGPNWTPVGGKYSMKVGEIKGDSLVLDARFNGVFDGQGYTVSNIYCDRFAEKGFPYSQCVGLIGFLGGASDLNPKITGEFADGWQPAVRNVVVGKGYIYGRRMVGGIVGRVGETNYGVVIENCANNAAVHNTDSKGIGGIIGAGWGMGFVRNCYNTGNVTTTYACPAGGICGSNNGLSIYNCYNTGKIDSNGQKRGRGIGGHDAGSYTVTNCYYLEGSDDDPDSRGWYKGASKKITVSVSALPEAEMRSASFAGMLNASGNAFVSDTGNVNGGYPVLYFQAGGAFASSSFEVEAVQPEFGGSISADVTGKAPAGKTVTLTAEPEAGYLLKYYTLNGERLESAFFTLSQDSAASAVFGKVVPVGVSLPSSDEYYLAVTRTGYKMSGGEMVYVTGDPISDGDTVLEGNILTVRAAGWDDVFPQDVHYEYTDDFTVTGTNAVKNPDGTFTVDGSGGVSIGVTRGAQLKSWLSGADTSWYVGERSEYILQSGAELAGVAFLVNREGVTFEGVTVYLDGDISLNNTDGTAGIRVWKAIGANTTRAFKGTFDGKGHVIRDMTAYNDGSYAGLFGYCAGAAIRNVTVAGTVEGKAASSYAAGIVAYAAGSVIENCVNRASVTASGTGAAGIAAYISEESTVAGCVNRGTVSGTTGVGGIVGISYTGGDTITGCVNYGAVKAAGEGAYGVGGVAGRLAGTAAGCANYGAVDSADRYTGGIAGYATAKNLSAVKNSLNAAGVSSNCGHKDAALGGLVGYGQYLTLANSKNSGTVTKAAAFASANFGETVGRSGAVTETPLTDESVFPKPEADTPPPALSPPSGSPGSSGLASGASGSGPYKITFMADGKTVEAVTYTPGEKPAAPALPQKAGYTARWEDYETEPPRNITVRAVYRQINARGGDDIQADGTYFLGFYASGLLTVGGGLDVVLDGSNGLCENLAVTVGGGTKLTLRNVNITGASAVLTTEGGVIRFEGKNTLASVSDVKGNLNPALMVNGDTELTGAGSMIIQAGINNSAVKVAAGKTLTLSAGDVTVVKTEMLGEAGGAVHAPGGTVKISGGTLTGRTNSDNVAVVFAKNAAVSGGFLRLEAERSPYVLQAERAVFDGGELYAVGHSGNSAAESMYYYGRDAVSGLAGAVKGTFASAPPSAG